MCYFCILESSDSYNSNADLSIGKILTGGNDNDLLTGTAGYDSIYGKAGDDLIDGGVGADYLRGGDGADQFVLRRGDGRDTIFDFEDGLDKLLLKDGLTYEELNITQEYGRTVISISDTGEVLADLLYEVNVSQLGSEDFIEFSDAIEKNNINESQKNILELEDFQLEGYEKEGNQLGLANFPASSGELVKLSSDVSNGKATKEFTGLAGSYDILVGYFDENDGEAKLELGVNNTTVDSWILAQNLPDTIASAKTFTTRLIQDVELNPGDLLSIVGIRDQAEFARVDFLELIPNTQIEVGLAVALPY